MPFPKIPHDSHKQTMVLLHGYLRSIRDYDPFYAKFSNKYNIIAIDLRGHVNSDSNGNWIIDELVYDIYQIVRLLMPENEKIVMVGNSLSTAITLKFASKYPELILKIFLISPTKKFNLSVLTRLSIHFVCSIPNKIINFSLRILDKLTKKQSRSNPKEKVTNSQLKKILDVPVRVHKNILRDAILSYKLDPLDFHLPMLIIAGELDTVVPFADSVFLNASAVNSSILILENTQHHILIKRTNLILDIFEQWIETQTDLLTDLEHYHEIDIRTDAGGQQMLPEEWLTSDCKITH